MDTLNIELERKLLQSHYDLVVGIDEAGRGPWAGPVSIAAYIFRTDSEAFKGVNDSKKLSKLSRELLYTKLTSVPSFYCVLVDSQTIDESGVGKTIETTIESIIQSLQVTNPTKRMKFLIDGYFKTKFDADYELITKGDSKIYSIASASIIAKVARDHEMLKFAKTYPEYGFEDHVGYGTKRHMEALTKYGICPIHRRSFKPIKRYI